jgi:hypothetical protein
MSCAEIEILICDYVDGTLAPAERAEVERHLADCPACAEMVRDATAAVTFMERAADVEPPPELITRIVFYAPWNKGRPKPSPWRKWLAGALGPILQPKFAMGMAMTILSLSMLLGLVAPAPLSPKDWKPTRVWASVQDRASYAWGRTVKFYDNLKLVYQIQTTLRTLQQQDEEQRPAAGGDNSEGNADERKLPEKGPSGQKAPVVAPSSNQSGETR